MVVALVVVVRLQPNAGGGRHRCRHGCRVELVALEVAARESYYQHGLNYHAGEGGHNRCLGLIDQYGVTFDGDFIPCCVWGEDELVLGNVFRTPLRELWGSEAVQMERERMYRDGCSVGCYNHSLYEFEVATGASFQVE